MQVKYVSKKNTMCKKYIFLSLFILSVTAQALINKANAQDLTKAFQYFNTGQYKQAASEFETAILIVEKEYGNKDTSNYSKLLLYTAVCFDRCTNYIKAEQYYLQSIAVYKSVNAVYAPMYATACNNLAELYREAGNFEKAEALYIEAKEIDEKIYGKNHANYGTDCNNLALLYHTTGNYKKAEYLYITAKNVAGKVL